MRKIATYSERDVCFKLATDAYQRLTLDEFVAHLRKYHSDAMLDQPEECEIDDVEEVCSESECYVLTTDDAMGCLGVNIYEK